MVSILFEESNKAAKPTSSDHLNVGVSSSVGLASGGATSLSLSRLWLGVAAGASSSTNGSLKDGLRGACVDEAEVLGAPGRPLPFSWAVGLEENASLNPANGIGSVKTVN